MEKKTKNKKQGRNKLGGIPTGMALGIAVVLAAEVTVLALGDKAIIGGYSSILEGKAMGTDSFEDALDEYSIVQGAYNYYLSGGTSTYYTGEFDFHMMESEYYNAKSAGEKTYLKNCLDKKLIEYCNENPDAQNINIQDIYEDALWEIILNEPTTEYDENKTLDDYLEECYGEELGSTCAEYTNLELTEEEEKTVQFIKKGR